MWSVSAVLLGLCGLALGQQCFDKPVWSTGNGNILLNGQPFVLKGLNYMGFETSTRAPHGIAGNGANSLGAILDFVKNNNFNAIRLPFSLSLVRDNPSGYIDCGLNPTLCNKPALTVMSSFIDECAKRGIVVLLDHHLFNDKAYNITELWYSNEFNEQAVIDTWKKLLGQVGKKWNVFALDLKNEPHGAATWGNGNYMTDWNGFAERLIKAVAPSYDGLFFVEGVDWGGDLSGVKSKPINTGNSAWNKRVVYAPHTYGPEEWDHGMFQTADFPRNMPAYWDKRYGFVEKQTGNPVVVGEWGSRYQSGSQYSSAINRGKQWIDAQSNYLIQNCMSDNFYWTINPSNYGVMNTDWRTGQAPKLELLRKTQPNPTKLSLNANKICISSAGSYPNSACKK